MDNNPLFLIKIAQNVLRKYKIFVENAEHYSFKSLENPIYFYCIQLLIREIKTYALLRLAVVIIKVHWLILTLWTNSLPFSLLLLCQLLLATSPMSMATMITHQIFIKAHDFHIFIEIFIIKSSIFETKKLASVWSLKIKYNSSFLDLSKVENEDFFTSFRKIQWMRSFLRF